MGNIPISGIPGTFEENTMNNNGQDLKHSATYNELEITNSFYRKKHIHKYTWSSRSLWSIIDNVTANKKLSTLVQVVRVHRGSDINSDDFLVISKKNSLAR